MLLQWCTLEPSGTANLAAIRFSSPVRVQNIRIFPTDTQPFVQHPDIVSRTEPEAFYLELYFNAYRVATPNSKEKPKPTNVLVPTVLAYTGGQMDFSVPMAAEYATRLMIVRGNYEYVSLAIYGEIMAELPSPPTTYEPRPLPTLEPIPLTRALDPSNSLDPSALARQLLSLIPDAPPLPLAIRLVFCLKPPSDDWDLPDFPYLHPDLDNETEDFDLEKAFRLTTRPVPDDVSDATLLRFAENVTRSVRSKNSNQPYLVAGILAHAASQHPNMARLLLESLDLTRVFDMGNLRDEMTLIRLRDAATNPDIARYLNNEWFLGLVSAISKDVNTGKETQLAASKLILRVEAWAVFEDALSNTQGDLTAAATFIREVGTEEQSLGVWLESMVTHEDVVNALAENPNMPIPLPHPPYLFGPLKSVIHDGFIAFLRAVIGVAAVLAVYAFADAYPHKVCRERALSIIRLWQGVDGYREIVNHFLLLKQMIFRLDCMMDNDPPRRAGLDAEHVLVNLAKSPRAMLQPDVIKCILSLRPPHSFITSDERVAMRQAAIVADDGLPGAVEELLRPLERPLTLTNMRSLRVALAVIDQELGDQDEQGEYRVLQDFWTEGSISLIARLVDLFIPVSEEIKTHFSLKPPERKPQELMTELFRTANELLELLLRLYPTYLLASRAVSDLAASVADLFVCTDAADMLFAQSSPPCVAAQETRQACIDVIRAIGNPFPTAEGGRPGAEVVLRELLEHGLRSEDRDPVHHLLQVFCLVDYLLPMPGTDVSRHSVWTQRVMPLLLRELWAFCRVLDTENKAHFVKRLIDLDQGVAGIGEWLLLGELKELQHALQEIEDPSTRIQERAIRHSQVFLSLRFLLELASGSSRASTVFVECVIGLEEATAAFVSCFMLMFDQHLTSSVLTELAQLLAHYSDKMGLDLHCAIALTLLRSGREPNIPTPVLSNILTQCLSLLAATELTQATTDKFRLELGRLFDHLHNLAQTLQAATAESCVALLEWLCRTAAPAGAAVNLVGITEASYMNFCDQLRSVLSEDWMGRLDAVQSKINISIEETPGVIPPIPLPDSVKLTIRDLEELLQPAIPVPSTPPRRTLNQDALGLVTISPPALIRSPASTGLTKTYNNNDFRQLRQIPAARQNTSRLPSMHVDEFESAASPTIVTIPMPMTATLPFAAEGFQPLAPPFNPI